MRLMVILPVALLAVSAARADDADFARDVQPILAKHCVRCHGPKKQEGGLRLDVRRRALGIGSRDIKQVVLTHLHTDHAGGLHHVTGSRIWVTRGELERAAGIGGRVQGYLPHRWQLAQLSRSVRAAALAQGPGVGSALRPLIGQLIMI